MGFGTSPAGLFPAGFSAATTATAPPPQPAGSRFIDPYTRDYSITATGQQLQVSELRQRVTLALLTQLGSSTALTQLGLQAPGRISQSIQAEVEQAVRAALRRLIETERAVTLVSVTTERQRPTGRLAARIVWRATDASEQQQETLWL